MKALTIRQPHATLIALGVKSIETRSWRAPKALIGQTIAIHAGKHRPAMSSEVGEYVVDSYMSDDGWQLCLTHRPSDRWGFADLPLGAIVAIATLADCVPMVEATAELATRAPDPCLVVGYGDDLTLYHPTNRGGLNWGLDADDQLPYGDFRPGRWAWMLTDVQPTTSRCPACMGEGQHEWNQSDDCQAADNDYADYECEDCGGTGTCPPIKVKGKQGLWEWTPA